jgi:hypothetical protein
MLLGIAMPIVAPTEGDGSIDHADETAVRDSDTVGVAGTVASRNAEIGSRGNAYLRRRTRSSVGTLVAHAYATGPKLSPKGQEPEKPRWLWRGNLL